MRKGEKENLRIQLGERFYDYVEKCRKFLGWNQKKICEEIANSMNGEETDSRKKIKRIQYININRKACQGNRQKIY